MSKPSPISIPSEQQSKVQQRVLASSAPPNERGCRRWLLSKKRKGYGQIRLKLNGRYRTLRANRVSYAAFNGALTEDDLVRHVCDDPACVEPSHLIKGTCADNSADMIARGRVAKEERHSQSKLTWEQAAVAKQRIVDGDSDAAIAEDLPVTQRAVAAIRRGDTWRSVPWPRPRQTSAGAESEAA